MKKILAAVAAIGLAGQPLAATARDIVIGNDDGLTSNLLALYRALKADGHDVIVSVPCQNQSGMGTAMTFGRPLAPLREACRAGAAPVGAPAAGPMSREGIDPKDFYYVDGTPVMALTYGLDVVAAKRWGSAPDLVLSGPNEGQNVGAIILSSGTVSVAQTAALRGLPAIALSAGGQTVDDKTLANPTSTKIATEFVRLVRQLDQRAGSGPVLPRGLALNVNFPDKLDGLAWRASKIGTYNAYAVRFVENMARDASPTMREMAKAHGAELPALPGLAIDMNTSTPTAGQQDDEAVVYRNAIAVSPMRAGYQPSGTDDLGGFELAPLLPAGQ